jgi:hypothetical protein
LGWLITWLLLALLAGLAVVTRRGRRHPPADETLIAELLGPSEPPTVRVLPAPALQPQEDEPRPALQPQEDEPLPAPAALPAGEVGWLETQLALIAAWSERMQQQIASSHADPDPWRCIAITTKGSQCKLLAEPGDTKCAIHGGRPDRLPSRRVRATAGRIGLAPARRGDQPGDKLAELRRLASRKVTEWSRPPGWPFCGAGAGSAAFIRRHHMLLRPTRGQAAGRRPRRAAARLSLSALRAARAFDLLAGLPPTSRPGRGLLFTGSGGQPVLTADDRVVGASGQ